MGDRSLSRRGMTSVEAAEYLSVSDSFLRRSRCEGDREGRAAGPPWSKIGRRIIYAIARPGQRGWLAPPHQSHQGCLTMAADRRYTPPPPQADRRRPGPPPERPRHRSERLPRVPTPALKKKGRMS